jgi:hypothetical protein
MAPFTHRTELSGSTPCICRSFCSCSDCRPTGRTLSGAQFSRPVFELPGHRPSLVVGPMRQHQRRYLESGVLKTARSGEHAGSENGAHGGAAHLGGHARFSDSPAESRWRGCGVVRRGSYRLRPPWSFRTIIRKMTLIMQCHSGRKADERPLRFWPGGRRYQVEAVLDQWYDPEHIFYKVRGNDGNLCILRQQMSIPDGQWELVSFRDAESDRNNRA